MADVLEMKRFINSKLNDDLSDLNTNLEVQVKQQTSELIDLNRSLKSNADKLNKEINSISIL